MNDNDVPGQLSPHVPEQVESQLLGLLLAGYVALIILPHMHCSAQLIGEGQLQLVLTDVLLNLHGQYVTASVHALH